MLAGAHSRHDYSKKDDAEGSKPAFAPRTQKKKAKEGSGNDESEYKDRAALRRAGADGEYKDVSWAMGDADCRWRDCYKTLRRGRRKLEMTQARLVWK